MELNYKIHHKNSVIYLKDKDKDKDKDKEDNLPEISITSKNELKKIIDDPPFDKFSVVQQDCDSLLHDFISFFTHIHAGGGLVINDKRELLFIYRKEKWDLPKGKIEKGETIEQASIREVEEETGVLVESIIAPLPDTFHTYLENNNWIFKSVHWFLMKGKASHLAPQLEEGITKVIWLPSDEIAEPLKDTYPSIKDVINNGIEMIPDR